MPDGNKIYDIILISIWGTVVIWNFNTKLIVRINCVKLYRQEISFYIYSKESHIGNHESYTPGYFYIHYYKTFTVVAAVAYLCFIFCSLWFSIYHLFSSTLFLWCVWFIYICSVRSYGGVSFWGVYMFLYWYILPMSSFYFAADRGPLYQHSLCVYFLNSK